MNQNRILSVSQLNSYLQMMMDGDKILSDVLIRGELSNYKCYSSGHAYFTLKDEEGQLRAVMFRTYASRLPFSPEDGRKVIAHGRVSVYGASGQYQLYVDEMQPDGIGALSLQFEQLKKKLESEGLFDEDRKKPIPKMPMSIGVITSPSGAAVHDMIHVLGRRFPLAKMILFPSAVQGADAPAELISGLRFFNLSGMVDLMIIGRGGGSAEDLWAFNNEELAREVAASKIPVISAVGHESDFTICDFVADLRAPTPSAAAELAVPDREELLADLSDKQARLSVLLMHTLTERRQLLAQISHAKVFRHPESILDSFRQKADEKESGLREAIENRIRDNKQTLSRICAKLSALDPLGVLSRGYAVVTDQGKKSISSVGQVAPGDSVNIRVSDGSFEAAVKEISWKRKN